MIDRRFITLMSVIYIISVLLFGALAYWLILPEHIEQLPAKANIKEAADKALSLATEMIKLIITLSTGMIGVCLWIIKRPLTDQHELLERIFWCLCALISFSLSLYFGFIALDVALKMLSWGSFDARQAEFWRAQTFQYYCFVVGSILLGFSCIRSINAIREAK